MTTKRTTSISSRHIALGSNLEEWNDMGMPFTYDQDVNVEHRTVRTKAGLFDVSGLRKVYVTGPDALAVCEHVCTRDLSGIYPGKSAYALILNEEGRITDDAIMFHIMPNCWLMVHGSGTAVEQITKSAEGKDVQIAVDNELHTLSVQGSASVDFLNEHADYDLPSLKYFHHVQANLFGYGCMISRTGYSGERGYEIYARPDEALGIWDAVVEHGKEKGIIPCSLSTVDMLRVEAGLFFYPYDMNEEDTPWDIGLGFAVSKNKESDYRGKEACMVALGSETTTTVGVVVDGETAAEFDAQVMVDGNKVGRVTGACYSTVMEASVCMARIDKRFAEQGQKLSIAADGGDLMGTVSTMPLYDPEKSKRA